MKDTKLTRTCNLMLKTKICKEDYELIKFALESEYKEGRASAIKEFKDFLERTTTKLQCQCEVCAFEGQTLHSEEKDKLIRVDELKKEFEKELGGTKK